MNYIFPQVDEDPREGKKVIDSRFLCQKCIQYGHVAGEEGLRIKPCTVCVMANGGAWGWEEGHYGDPNFSKKSNGLPPGKNGITDVLCNHDSNPTCDWDFLDEEVILGFVQYALYNHYKWKDILDLQQGKSKLRTGVPSEEYCDREDINHWYWWKLIPFGVVLPKRLMCKLQKQLVEYDIERVNPELFIPKTHQMKGERELSDDIWETFWDTYVEPGHVAHIFIMTMTKVLETIIPRQLNNNLFPDPGWLSNSLSEFSLVENQYLRNHGTLPTDIEWIDSHSEERFYENSKSFLIQGEGELFNQSPMNDNFNGCRVLQILDRDIFGTFLENVIFYNYPVNHSTSSFNRRYDVMPNNVDTKEHWNMFNNDVSSLFYDVTKRICFEETYYFEGQIDFVPRPISEYGNERFFREEIHVKTLPLYYSIQYEIDSSSDEENENNYDWSNHKEQLKVIQELIDSEEVKGEIQSGMYVQLMDNLLKLFKMCK